jgi:hypothetical protein
VKWKKVKKLNFLKIFSKIMRMFAGIVQLVEHLLAKEDVARSSRVTRFLRSPVERVQEFQIFDFFKKKWNNKYIFRNSIF